MRGVLSFISSFLPEEMNHIYRQVSNIFSYDSHVITRSFKNKNLFPFESLNLLKKSKLRIFKRFYYRLWQQTVPLSNYEVSQVLSYCENINEPVLHIYQGDVALRALNLLRNYQGPKVVSFHGADLSESKFISEYPKLWNHVDVVLCRCEAFVQKLDELGCPSPKIMLNYTGVPMPKDIKNPATFSFSSGKIKNLKILQVCRFLEKKGLETTIHAFSKLLQVGYNGSLDLVGDGPIKQSLINLVSGLGIADKVNFRGFLTGKDLMDCFMNADIFSHPSCITAEGDREGIPNSLLEAMSYGLPVVSSLHSGIPEVIKNRDNGLLINSHDIDSLTSSFIDIISTPHSSIKMAQKARETINSRFSIPVCVNELENSYNLACELKRNR
jgi:glycosyltransferase involved in cell wall biosynthesis